MLALKIEEESHEPKSVDGLCAVCLVTQSYPTLCDHMDCSPPGSSAQGDSSGKNTSVLPWPLSGDPPNKGIKPWCPALQVDSLLSEPPWKPKNTGVGSLSLLWGNFQTQESNQGLLHCRQFLYQLSFLPLEDRKGKKKKKQILTQSIQKATQCCQHPDFSPWDLSQT